MVCFNSCFTAFKLHRKRNQYLVVADLSSPFNHPRGKSALLLQSPTKEPSIPEQPINRHISPESKGKVEGEEARASCNVILVNKVEETQLRILPAEEVVSNVEKLGGGMEQHSNGGGELNQGQIEDGDEESEGGSHGRVVEESSESLFSISIGRNQIADLSEKEEEITSPVTTKCINPSHNKLKTALGSENASVPNPSVEDITTTAQLKSAAGGGGKARRQQHYQEEEDKENVNVDSNIESCPTPEFSFNPLVKKPQLGGRNTNKGMEHDDDDVAVDASLSNWLLVVHQSKESGDHSSAGCLPNKSRDDKKVVLGALAIGVLKQVDAANTPTTSPAKSRSKRFGGTPALGGTVGSYWRHSGRDVGL